MMTIPAGFCIADATDRTLPRLPVLHDFQTDIELISSIPAVPSILDVVCRLTGMGFAAIARVTEGRWVACATKDDIGFGMAPGGELKVETTICHEIRQHPEAVIIDNVCENPFYSGHHTPAMYGFQSYVSFPIILPDGTFFGTLCAIDPKPRNLHTPEIIGTFKLFAELIAFHLDSVRKLEVTQQLLDERREADRRQRILQRELAHRMKNTLAMVQAVVTQSLRNATSLADARHQASERIQALGRAQDMLTETNWEAADIRAVVQAAVAPHLDGGERFVIGGPAADVTAQQAMGLLLAIHELATNATKYGALSTESGQVLLSWTIDDRLLHLEWQERGGSPVVPPTSKGFGSRLTERVVPTYFNGKASLSYPEEGLHYVLDGTI
jgi:two-component sensor histidine kinase